MGEERLKWTLWKEIVKFGNWEGGRRKTEINIMKGNSKNTIEKVGEERLK